MISPISPRKSIKGNDGKRAKQVLLRKIVLILISFAFILFCLKKRKNSRSYLQDTMDDAPFTATRRKKLRALRNEHTNHIALDPLVNRDPFFLDPLVPEGDDDSIPEYMKGMEKIEMVLSGAVHLVGLQLPRIGRDGTYRGAKGEFCRLDWKLHKTFPAEVPMNRDLIAKSSHCQNHKFHLELYDAVEKARAYDENPYPIPKSQKNAPNQPPPPKPHVMQPAGFVFHESRCGSTLVANSLAVVSPQSHRVWSESQPPVQALLACGDEYEKCSRDVAMQLFRDVVYLMGRTDDDAEQRMFFKVQSAGSRYMDLVLDVFPKTPWIFVYRDPVQVMMSHVDINDWHKANCLRRNGNPHSLVKEVVQKSGSTMKEIKKIEYCAANLASLCLAALKQYNKSIEDDSDSIFINYNQLPDALYQYVFPNIFKIPVSDEETQRILDISSVYSKQRVIGKEWKDDSARKEKRANPKIVDAAEKFMRNIYEEMEALAWTKGDDFEAD